MLSNNVFKNGGGVLRGCFFFVFPLVMIPFHQQVKLNQSANFLLVLLAFNNLLFSFCWRWSFILELLYTESHNFVGQNAQNCQLKKILENAKNTKIQMRLFFGFSNSVGHCSLRSHVLEMSARL